MPACHENSRRGNQTKDAKPPKLTLCSNWAVVSLQRPLLAFRPTWAERSACSLAQVAVRYTASGADGNKRRVCPQNFVFLSSSPVAGFLPRDIALEEYLVVFCKLNDDEIRAHTKKLLLVQRVVTENYLREYRRAIGLYREIPDNEVYFAKGEYKKVLTDNYHDDGAESTISKETEEARGRPGRVQLMDAAEISTSAGYYCSADTESPTGLPCFRVTRSSGLMNHHCCDCD